MAEKKPPLTRTQKEQRVQDALEQADGGILVVRGTQYQRNQARALKLDDAISDREVNEIIEEFCSQGKCAKELAEPPSRRSGSKGKVYSDPGKMRLRWMAQAG